MYQTRTLDLGIAPWLRRPGGAYDASPAPKYLVEFTRAGHLAWTNLRADAHQAISDYSIAFLDRYVRDDRSDGRILTTMRPGVAEFRYQEGGR
jgi:hypothetical protein